MVDGDEREQRGEGDVPGELHKATITLGSGFFRSVCCEIIRNCTYDVRSSALLLVISSYFIIFSLYPVDFCIREVKYLPSERHLTAKFYTLPLP